MAERRPLRYPQLAKEALLTSRVRGNAENRIWAKLIDFALVEMVLFTVRFFFPWSFWVLPVILWANIDRMGRGQSPGKWLLGLHTVEVRRGAMPSLYNSLVRNLPFIFLSMAIGISHNASLLVILPLIAYVLLEAYFIFHIRSGLRVGDVLGNTRVADYKDEHTQFIEQFLKEDDFN